MAKQKATAERTFFQELFHVALYKRNQGRIARQLTFVAVAVTVGLGAFRWSDTAATNNMTMRVIVPGLILLLGIWLGYRLVNYTRFADFLISVEAEMSKVSWPTRTTLFRSSMVVLFTIFVLAAILFLYDTLWQLLFDAMGVTGGDTIEIIYRWLGFGK